jgi:signal transduction histidine kinase
VNRLATRLVLSHLLVALVGAAVTFVVVRQLAPTLFDESLRSQRGMGMGLGNGQGGMDPTTAGLLRDEVAGAVDQALLVGALVGIALGAVFGLLATSRLLRPIGVVREATRRLAAGRYDEPVPEPHETELADLVADVNTLRTALADTEQRRVRLLGEVAHEMRTPLTVIDGSVEGMIDGVIPASAEQLGDVSAEVRRLRRLTDDLSLLSRVSEGRERLDRRPVDLREVVRAAARRLEPQAVDTDVTLTVEPGTDPLPADADADRIAQVVTNLVGNALRATPAGGRVDVRTQREGSDALVAVTDAGVGLSPEELERVFERFYRGGAAGSGAPDAAHVGESGSGIGLTIARGLVEAHGGTLVATSPGRGLGATFTARLPLRLP